MIQLEKKGNKYTFSGASFGEVLQACELPNLDLGDEIYVGLFVCSRNAEVVEKGVFCNVRIIRPARDDFRPYRYYIGSRLELLDVTTGIHQSDKPFEASNWTTDGKTPIYNGSSSGDNRGKLHRFDLATREEELFNIDFANRNNHDHVFTVPVRGGKPKLITPNAPSYLHGWSTGCQVARLHWR